MSIAVVVLVIAIVIVLNLMCGLLMKRYPIKLDLTPDNRYELTDESIDAVKAIDKDIEITVMTTKNYFDSLSQQYEAMFYQYYGAIVEMPFNIIPEILEKYTVYAEQGSGSISVKYVDMNKDPDVVTRFNKYYNGEIEQTITMAITSTTTAIDIEPNLSFLKFFGFFCFTVPCPETSVNSFSFLLIGFYLLSASAPASFIKNSHSNVDMNKDPDVVTRFNKYYNGEIEQGSIVLYCNERVKVITPEQVTGMIAPTRDSTQTNINMAFAGESTITSAIRAVADANPVRTAVVTTMNGNSIFDASHESIANSFESFLSTNGYDCTEIDIASDALSPEEYDMVIVAAPQVDFSEDIIAKLSDFLYNGGNYEKDMIYIPNFYATNLPNINSFLEEWKISIEQSAVMDENMVQATYRSLNNMTDYFSGIITLSSLPDILFTILRTAFALL